MKFIIALYSSLFLAGFSPFLPAGSQMVTGTWQGKINRDNVEVKIIQNGDSLTGTSYYYSAPDHYRRYSIKGFFDSETNEVVWWDDQLIEVKPSTMSAGPGRIAMLARADFNCPGDGRMMLDGKTDSRGSSNPRINLHLDKTGPGIFSDEWDFVLDNYTTGANDPWIIDSIAAIAHTGIPAPVPPVTATRQVRQTPVTVYRPAETITEPSAAIPARGAPTIEEKFNTREKVFVMEIPLEGDSILLRFYDHGEIDGDSISLFLDNKLIFSHIRLAGTAYNIKLAVKDLNENNELTMVAENLGSIPPNTSYMIAVVNEKRYEARLESTEGSSAMIRLKKPGK